MNMTKKMQDAFNAQIVVVKPLSADGMLVPQGGLERFFELDVQAGRGGETARHGYGAVCSPPWRRSSPYGD